MKTKRKNTAQKTPHLWEVAVRHRDYVATANARNRGEIRLEEMHMTYTTLFISCPQPPVELPSIDKALAKTRSFLRRNQRQYGTPTITSMLHRGSMDD